MRTPTLGALAKVLSKWKKHKVSPGAIWYILQQVYWDTDWTDIRSINGERSRSYK